ncbi:hypothetical protein LXL04_032923 [Taraxacum kok-saghyz]
MAGEVPLQIKSPGDNGGPQDAPEPGRSEMSDMIAKDSNCELPHKNEVFLGVWTRRKEERTPEKEAPPVGFCRLSAFFEPSLVYLILLVSFYIDRGDMGVVKAAIGDGVLTFMWVFCASTLGAATSVIATAVGIQGMASLLITISLVFILLLIFGVIGDALGGASFNPTGTAAFYAAGLGRDSLVSAAVRFPAQSSTVFLNPACLNLSLLSSSPTTNLVSTEASASCCLAQICPCSHSGLKRSKNMEIDEQVAMFLHVLAHNVKNRVIISRFRRSGETISRHFSRVCNATIRLHTRLLKKPEPVPANSTGQRWKWFKNCLGALDGTYIKCLVPLDERPRYRTRKNDIATNVLGVCSQDSKGISGIFHEFQFHFLRTKQTLELIPIPFTANQTAYGIGFLFLTDSFSNSNSFSFSNNLPTKQPLRALGAVGGALAIVEVMPSEYKHKLGGPSLKVDQHTGAIAEGVLTFIVSLLVLSIILKGPKSPLIKNFLLSTSIVTMVVAGSSYTGPSMNPANAFGWAYVNKRHDTWEHFYVYWICPFVGAIFAGWVFRLFFPHQSKTKVKKTKTKKA